MKPDIQVVARIGDFVPGVTLAVLGCVVAAIGRQYNVGNLTAMGPGFLPVSLGILLLVLAAFLLFGQWVGHTAESSPSIRPLPLLLASSSLLIWALVVDFAGFIPAAILQLLLASLASKHARWGSVAISIVLVTIFSWLLFVGLLGLPIRAFG